jgi:prophage maintenance system killer protein
MKKLNKQATPLKGKVAIYQSQDESIQIKVKLENDTVWLTQKQMAGLFGRDVRTINEHIQNVFSEKELEKKSTIRNFRIVQLEGSRQVIRNVDFYNLDVIISVGYRVKSLRGTHFRIWATQVLKKHLIEGYTINEDRLTQQQEKLHDLQRAIQLIASVKDKKQLEHKEALGLLEVISDYNYALRLLDDFDNKRLALSGTSKKERFALTYETAIKAINEIKNKLCFSPLFGVERDKSFKSSIVSIYQTFGNKELYPSVEEKAANLLYFIVKNHSFVDGNKRIAASIFLWFLEGNGLLYRKNGSKRIADNALVALTLLVAESNPSERDIILKLIVNLINSSN